MPIPLGILAAAGFRPPVAAGDFVLLDSRVLTSTETSITFSSLGTYSTYKHLQIRLVAQGTRTGGNMELYATANGFTSYRSHWLVGDGSSVAGSTLGYSKMFLGNITGADATNNYGVSVIDIYDVFNTNKAKSVRAFTGTTTANNRIALHDALINTTNALSSFTLELEPGGFGFRTGSRIALYGVK
jgi:hypothetical protein